MSMTIREWIDMAAGASSTLNASTVNGQAGALAKEIESLNTRCREFQTWLASVNLQTDYSMSAAEEADIKSAFANYLETILVYEGRATVGNANAARTFMLRLVGMGAHL
jgi:hypothetical protein